jgi:hypothetical protein
LRRRVEEAAPIMVRHNAAVRRLIVVSLALLAVPGRASAEEPDLRTVLQRSATYVADFVRSVSGVVAEESYVQDVEAGAGKRPPAVSHRVLKSDLLLVQIPGRGYVEFRDVFEVDGRAVRDRQDRLTRLFMGSSSSTKAESIMAESARYNIGRATRTVNTQPMLPLMFLSADVQPNFEFTRASDARPATVNAGEVADGHFRASIELWVVEYREVGRGGFLRTPQGRDLRAQGRLWIEPATGRVVMTELTTDDFDVATTIDVTYQEDPVLRFSVPAEMRERYVLSPDNMIVRGMATYSRFRRFSVQTDETIAAPQPRQAATPEPSLRTVLERAASYVADFSRRLSGMVAEESYIQDVEAPAGGRAPDVSHRELKSDFLLVRLPGRDRYVEFRDVFDVDGSPVRDRQDRLTRLFLNPNASGVQAESIVAESARYNIGRVTRTVNTPMLPLLFLTGDVQKRFDFKRASDNRPATVKESDTTAGHFAVAAEVWVVEYREKSRGTVIRTPQGKDLPAHGRFWLDPETGRILMSELLTEDRNIVATIDVSYQSEPLLGLSVPAEMRERYELTPEGTVVTGTATYGRFRQVTLHPSNAISEPTKR